MIKPKIKMASRCLVFELTGYVFSYVLRIKCYGKKNLKEKISIKNIEVISIL